MLIEDDSFILIGYFRSVIGLSWSVIGLLTERFKARIAQQELELGGDPDCHERQTIFRFGGSVDQLISKESF